MTTLSSIYVLICLFVFSAYSAEDSEEKIVFTVKDTPKEFFPVEDTKKPEILEPAKEQESIALPEEVIPIVLEDISSEPESETVLENEYEISETAESEEIEIAEPEEIEIAEPEEIEIAEPEETEIAEPEEIEIAEPEETEIADIEIPKPKVDVLIVIDNSGSMKFILRGIGNKMRTFTESLSLLDYRLAFLTARVNPNQDKSLMALEYEGQIFTQQKFLEPGMNHQILIDTLVRGRKDKCNKPPYCGGRSERPLGALEAYLFSHNTEDFIRADSEGLAVVLITDNEENNGNQSATTAEDVVNIFNQRYPNKKFKAYTFTILDKKCQLEIRRKQFLFREGNFAPSVTHLAEQTDGKIFSLCLASYQLAAEQIEADFLFNAHHE